MSWIKLTSVTATNGSNIVAVVTGDTTNVKVGDALLLAGFDVVEIEGVFANQLQLRSAWTGATQTAVAANIVPTFGDFNNAVEEIRNLRIVTNDNMEAMELWWTQAEGTVTFSGYDGAEHTVRTAQQMDADVAAKEAEVDATLAAIDSSLAARTAEFNPANIDWDVDIDFSNGLQIIKGNGTHDQIDVSAAQDGSVMVNLPSKSVDFSRSSTSNGFNKSGQLLDLESDEPNIGDGGLSIVGGHDSVMLSSDDSSSYWSSTGATLSNSVIDDFDYVSITEDTNISNHSANYTVSIPVLAGETWTLQYVVHKNSTRNARIRIGGSSSGQMASAVFDIQNAEILVINVGNAEIQDRGDKVVCSVTATFTQDDSTSGTGIYIAEGTSLTYEGDGVSGLFVTRRKFSKTGCISQPTKTETTTKSVSSEVATIPSKNNLPGIGNPFAIVISGRFPKISGSSRSLIDKDSSNDGFALTVSSSGYVVFVMNDGNGGSKLITGPLNDGGEHLFILEYTGDSIRMSIDGIEYGSETLVYAPNINYETPIYIGSNNGSSGFLCGEIRKYRTYFGILNSEQRQALGGI